VKSWLSHAQFKPSAHEIQELDRRVDAYENKPSELFTWDQLKAAQLEIKLTLHVLRTHVPKFKVLKGVAHNIGHSFVSLMNYWDDDYAMGHILRFAREAEVSTLTIDLLTGQGTPASLLRDPISNLPDRYSKMFLTLVHSSGSDRELIQSATLTLKYDLQRNESAPIIDVPQNPYTCQVSILDVRGKRYAAYFSGYWFVQRGLEIPPVRRWWNPFNWLRSR
jgi:hypothetical protein